MARSLEYSQQPWTETYSEIVDVRSPSEFAEDCMPGAVNLPVLDDEQRAKVGIIYKQVCPFQARKLGAALVAQNIANHLNHHFALKDKDYHPLVYCWRGGQRSSSMALVLSQIGWRVTVLEGGYKTYRAYVRDQLEYLPEQFTYRVLCGLTGSGKTHILHKFAQRGVQVLDLEGLANHRGSLLGQAWEGQLTPQPSQKQFESLLLKQLQSFDASKPVWVEAESNKIGKVYLPPSLWQRMKQTSCIEVQLSQVARIEWLLQDYSHFVTHPELLKRQLERLNSRYGKQKIAEWHGYIDAGQWHGLVGDLLTHHYDPAYRRSIEQCFNSLERKLEIADLSDASVDALLDVLSSVRD
ncbi:MULTISPECIES: tRNA 2-selenouridine(34) synthase MnmH [unclassified Coleofasciculus]|uniref:tRNA 2-selenouridine(34) synthase MnmH n=1 Tax=unclassified Coleofasciculus TaxID=2692782 RepID=UPI0018815D64|nr:MULTISPECIES: tRNA 2-selenouridine(34) synthase MnmH [unclassified Coleofasciculus]MBE9126911.1 tRNA 2-selenouridine(34) synthase MnmH [Coleofasciculus sp. LEGE 07081]MBE9150193.1 tRNA 2-selenouridine(34) synthase MnmH [Coleofasciculus sp. LEGE 07092]